VHELKRQCKQKVQKVLATIVLLCEDSYVDSDNNPHERKHMSLEETLKYHADALLKLAEATLVQAAAIRETKSADSPVLSAPTKAGIADLTAGRPVVDDAPPSDPVTEVGFATAAKEAAQRKEREAKKDAATVQFPAEPAAKKGSTTDALSDDSLDPDEPLDYEKHVKPVLLQVNRAKGRDALAGLLKKFGAPTGDKLPADKFAEVLATAEAILAGK
jgi:hypothetical protein